MDIVKSEADRSELIKIIFDLVNPDKTLLPYCTLDDITDTLNALPTAVAIWLKHTKQEADGDLRGEMHDGFIFNLSDVAESVGHGIADGVVIPAHKALSIKAHKGFLNQLSASFGIEVKNQ